MRVRLSSPTPKVNTDMKLNELADEKKEIVIVCGNISSGKGHYVAQYYRGYTHISVSSIVKELSQFNKRSQLGTTAHLADMIVGRLKEAIGPHKKVVVDGIRQISILEQLVDFYGKDIKDIIWLDVPEETLRARFEKRGSAKDDLSFDKALQSDRQLGINNVEDYIRKAGRVIPY